MPVLLYYKVEYGWDKDFPFTDPRVVSRFSRIVTEEWLLEALREILSKRPDYVRIFPE